MSELLSKEQLAEIERYLEHEANESAVSYNYARILLARLHEVEAERLEYDRALRLVLSRAQVDWMHELQRQGFRGTIHEAREQGLIPDEFKPALALVTPATSEEVGQ